MHDECCCRGTEERHVLTNHTLFYGVRCTGGLACATQLAKGGHTKRSRRYKWN